MGYSILGTFYDECGKAQLENLLVSFLNGSLRIRLELGTRTSFVVPFGPIVKLIQAARRPVDGEVVHQIAVDGHYSRLDHELNITKGPVLVTYESGQNCERIGLSAAGCGKIEVRVDRLIPYVDAGTRCILMGAHENDQLLP